jgi:hypothetical protein
VVLLLLLHPRPDISGPVFGDDGDLGCWLVVVSASSRHVWGQVLGVVSCCCIVLLLLLLLLYCICLCRVWLCRVSSCHVWFTVLVCCYNGFGAFSIHKFSVIDGCCLLSVGCCLLVCWLLLLLQYCHCSIGFEDLHM